VEYDEPAHLRSITRRTPVIAPGPVTIWSRHRAYCWPLALTVTGGGRSAILPSPVSTGQGAIVNQPCASNMNVRVRPLRASAA